MRRQAPPAFRQLAAALFSVALGSCAALPAKLRPDREHRAVEGSPGELLEAALRDPDSGGGRHALAHFVAGWFADRGGEGTGEIVEGGRRFQVRFVADRPGCYRLDYFDQIEPALQFAVREIPHHRRAGVGAPLLALRENRRREPVERYYPPEAITRPVTAVAWEGAARGGVRQVTLRLLSPLAHDTVDVRGRPRPLAADFTVPWAALLQRSGSLRRTALRDALRREPRREPRLYLMEPYDPRKEPLVMIHGLFDTPLKWAEVSNELWADDEVRGRYQIWHYLYNTSAPALYSSRLLRSQLRELRRMLDPDGDDPAMRRTTLLTHSMGGIVGRALVVRPGEVFWDAAFTRPIGDLRLSAADRTALEEAFFWRPEQHVKRVIFVAVPHRGSDRADSFTGRLGRLLVGPPRPFREFYERVSEANPGAFTESYRRLGTGRLDSVHALSPKQPTLKILSGLPIGEGVAVHSIIGDRGAVGVLEDSHDGLVPYWSSHLDSADSEKVVPAGHDAFMHPDGLAEIVRILKLPAGSIR